VKAPFVQELLGREIFCLGCGRHFVTSKCEAISQIEAGKDYPQPLLIRFPDGTKTDLFAVPETPQQPPQTDGFDD